MIEEMLRELYKDAQSRERLKDAGAWDVDTLLESVEREPPRELSLQALMTYTGKSSRSLGILLSSLPPKTVSQCFGDEALVWTLTQCRSTILEEMLMQVVELITSSKAVLEKTLLVRWCRFAEKSMGDLLKVYQLVHRFKYDEPSFDISGLLKECARPGMMVSSERIREYTIEPITPEENKHNGYVQKWHSVMEHGLQYTIYLDAPLGFGLMYKGKPIAVAGFNIENPHTVMIHQLQGIRPRFINEKNMTIGTKSTRGLMPLDWEKLMMQVVAHWAQDAGFSELAIQSGRFNSWAGSGESEDTRLSFEQAYRRYDGTAQRLGFEKRIDENWYLQLK